MAETTIHADGKSPLSCYVHLLVSVPAHLELLLDRDAEAVRILTATPALSEAIRRTEHWYWDRVLEKQTGGIVLTRRIWTRRDERRVNMLRGLSEGWWPPCRAARYLDRLQPRSGASSHDKWFRSAVDEARRDGTAAVLCPKLEQAKAIYERLISAARSVAQDDGGRGDFDSANIELGSLACELMNWTKQPGSSNTTPARLDVGGNAAQGDDQAEATKPTGKPAKVNERMAGTIMENPEAMGWNSAQWARHLKCGKSSVVQTATWKKLESARQLAKAERMKDRRRKPKASDSRRD
jgi:hypothetical protein